MGFGSRGMGGHSSAAYREASVRIATALAERYAPHPAVVMWHVHNEFGVPNGEDFSPESVAAFRAWLADRYGSIDGLNEAWGTAVWGQHYTTWDHVDAPRTAPSVINPGQKLDWARFTDHQLRQCYIAERDAIRAHASQPITTNFMANQHWGTDLWAWGREVDIVSDDHYLVAADEEGEIGLAIAADLTRSVGGGKPWILMEHSTSGVNWQERNVAKRAGEMKRNSLSHLARGADAICFFQWRAARYGQEKFHSAMLPHGGTATRVWREVVDLGATLGQLADVQGSVVQSRVAMLWDFESFWAQDLEWRPSIDLTHKERVRAWYEGLWRKGVTIDFAHPSQDLTAYDLVIAPAQYLLTDADAQNLTGFVAAGGTLVVSCFAAAVNGQDAVHEQGYAAPLAEVLGLRVEEYLPLRADAICSVRLPEGDLVSGNVWQEHVVPTTADVWATNVDGPAADLPAVTRNTHGQGTAWYVPTKLGADGIEAVLTAALRDADLAAPDLPRGVELVRRRNGDAAWTFAINHGDDAVELHLDGQPLVGNTPTGGTLRLDAGDVAVVRTTA